MTIPPDSSQEHPSTYFVEDRSSQDELTRLTIQDDLLTNKMGGVLPEQPDPTIFKRVLDVGCGTGGWLIAAAKAYSHMSLLVGVDVSRKMVEYSRLQAQASAVSDRVEFHTMDALRMLEFPSGYFDLVNQRAALSFLRTWDWPKILSEYQRVVRPGGVIRLTEADVVVETNSSALASLAGLAVQASYQSGHLFTADNGSVLEELPHLLQNQGCQHVQTRDQVAGYRAGSVDFAQFAQDMQLLLRTGKPFLSKWMRVPDEYEEICQQALNDMQQTDFVATWHYRTVWGINPLGKKQQ